MMPRVVTCWPKYCDESLGAGWNGGLTVKLVWIAVIGVMPARNASADVIGFMTTPSELLTPDAVRPSASAGTCGSVVVVSWTAWFAGATSAAESIALSVERGWFAAFVAVGP